jgi:isopenicillin-N synthase
LPGFEQFMSEYYFKMVDLAHVLLKGFALAANKPENFFEKLLDKETTMSTLRLNYYPFAESFQPVQIAEDGTRLGCETHTDGSLITILYQPVVGGLQVESENGWIEMEPSKENFVVNTGKCMSYLSNSNFKVGICFI